MSRQLDGDTLLSIKNRRLLNGVLLDLFPIFSPDLNMISPTHNHDVYYHGSYSGGDCCPLVVDPKTLLALKAFIGLATYFLRERITMSNLMMAKRRRKRSKYKDWIFIGEK